MFRWKDFKWKIRKIIWSFQRMKRGYSDCDIWSIDCWFLRIMPKMLKQLKETRHGSPAYIKYISYGMTDKDCHEVWSDILDRMIFLLKEMDEDKCSYKNPYEKEYEEYLSKAVFSEYLHQMPQEGKRLQKLYVGEEQNKYNYINSCKQEFFDLFSKYFYDLWD